MKSLTDIAMSLLMLAAVGLVGCAEPPAPEPAIAEGATMRVVKIRARSSAHVAADETCQMIPLTPATPVASKPGQPGSPRVAMAMRLPSVGCGGGRCAMSPGSLRPAFGASPGPASRQMHSQAATGQLAVARIESLAARPDSAVDGIGILMHIAGSDAPAAVRRSAAFAISRLHEKAGNLDKAAQILARITLLPDDPRSQVRAVGRVVDRPMPSDQAPQEVREAAERLEHRRRELNELARQLEQQQRELARRQRELEQLARRLRQGEHDDD